MLKIIQKNQTQCKPSGIGGVGNIFQNCFLSEIFGLRDLMVEYGLPKHDIRVRSPPGPQ